MLRVLALYAMAGLWYQEFLRRQVRRGIFVVLFLEPR
jgi:hypothetical protein